MSMEVTSIGQQLTAMDRRLEGSVNSTLRSTSEALQTADNTARTTLTDRISAEKVSRIVEQIQGVSNLFDRKLSFQVNKELDEVVVNANRRPTRSSPRPPKSELGTDPPPRYHPSR